MLKYGKEHSDIAITTRCGRNLRGALIADLHDRSDERDYHMAQLIMNIWDGL
jgi:hypothetical protein